MKILDIDAMKRPGAEAATFNGHEHGANVSIFVVAFTTGHGPRRHRHPYEETFVILEGEIQLIADGTPHTIRGGSIAVIAPGTWHEFKVTSAAPARMVNVHPVATMVTEWAE